MLDRTEMRRILMQSIVECSAPDFTKETISRGIDAGLEKIETLQIKRDGQKTFEVSAVPSGYGFWSRGGFDRLKNCGDLFIADQSGRRAVAGDGADE